MFLIATPLDSRDPKGHSSSFLVSSCAMFVFFPGGSSTIIHHSYLFAVRHVGDLEADDFEKVASKDQTKAYTCLFVSEVLALDNVHFP